MRLRVRIVSLALAALLLVPAVPTLAAACGAFFRRATQQVVVPSLLVEHVLILHDGKKQEEHLIREVVFQSSKEPFGFVVPTPTQPTVAKVDRSPFFNLADRFRPEQRAWYGGLGHGFGVGGGRGAGAAGGHSTVTVLAQEKVGSFTAFVLSATDPTALKRWLTDNQLGTTPATEAWLAHYVRLGFFFVAFRYEPQGEAGRSTSEVVRLSFKTPLPYYPYLEPTHTPDPSKPVRVLAVWFVGEQRMVPVALQEQGESRRWARPWLEDNRHASASFQLLRGVLTEPLLGLLPAGIPPADGSASKELDRTYVVQTFEDQKRDRTGWGDVVLVPEQATAPIDTAAYAKLAAALDPTLASPAGSAPRATGVQR